MSGAILARVYEAFAIPSYTKLEEKLWGAKQKFGKTDICYILQGGYCSWHYHQFTINNFLVVSGSIAFIQQNLEKATFSIGDTWSVGPYVTHKFKALENSIVLENYDYASASIDIVRKDTGGINEYL